MHVRKQNDHKYPFLSKADEQTGRAIYLHEMPVAVHFALFLADIDSSVHQYLISVVCRRGFALPPVVLERGLRIDPGRPFCRPAVITRHPSFDES